MSIRASMKFTPAPGGEIEFRHESFLDALLPLGALLFAYHRAADTMDETLPTDLAGLEMTQRLANEAITGIGDLLEAAGYLAAYADRRNIPDEVWNSLQWAQISLAHLLREVNFVGDVAARQAKRLETAATGGADGGS